MSLLKRRLGNILARARQRGGDIHPVARTNLKALAGIDPSRPARSYRYVVVDLETTGLDPRTDRVVSVGAVGLREGRIQLGDRFFELVNPGRDISPEAVKIHGITPDRIAGARHGALVLADFCAFLGDAIMVAHYARFDLHFINHLMTERYGFVLQNLVLDTVRMCRSVVLPHDPYGVMNRENHCALDALAERFGLKVPERHTALGDALATALLFQRMLALLEEAGGRRLRDVLRVALLS